MNRTDIINFLIKKYDYKNYLEIGVRSVRDNFNKIACLNKTGIDPRVPLDHYGYSAIGHQVTSDEFFKNLSTDVKYDIIFIDGLHTEEQVDKDIFNSLLHLAENGTIVMHDCNPPDIEHERENRCGTVWRSFYKAKRHPQLVAYVIDTDYGCGIIQKNNINKSENNILDYGFLEQNRKDVLNLITIDEFNNIMR